MIQVPLLWWTERKTVPLCVGNSKRILFRNEDIASVGVLLGMTKGTSEAYRVMDASLSIILCIRKKAIS